MCDVGRVIVIAVLSRYASVRLGLRAMLEGRDGISHVEEAGSISELSALTPRPDIVIFDFDEESIEQTADAAAELSAGLVLLGAGADMASCLTDVALRGWALLSRDVTADELHAASLACAAGLIVLTGSALRLLQEPSVAFHSGPDSDYSLTPREREILQSMADGLANKQIAAKLEISLHTVKFHVAAILSKLDVSSRTEAVTAGVRGGLVHL